MMRYHPFTIHIGKKIIRPLLLLFAAHQQYVLMGIGKSTVE